MLNNLKVKGETDKGFTLVELLVVLVILGTLASVVLLRVNGSTKWADLKSCKANWNLLYNANLQYQNDLMLSDDTNQTYSQREANYYDLKDLAAKGYLDNGYSPVESIASSGISKANNCNMQLINGDIYLMSSSGQSIPIRDIDSLSSPESLNAIVDALPTISEPIGGFAITNSGAGTIVGTKLDQIVRIFFKESTEAWPGREGSISKTSSTTALAFNAVSGKYQSAKMILQFADGTYWYSKYLYTFG